MNDELRSMPGRSLTDLRNARRSTQADFEALKRLVKSISDSVPYQGLRGLRTAATTETCDALLRAENSFMGRLWRLLDRICWWRGSSD